MKRKLVAVVSAVLLSLTTAAAAFAAAPTGEWHRLNPGDPQRARATHVRGVAGGVALQV